MPGPAPKTDKWTARENTHQKIGVMLIVSGLVQVSNTNRRPGLKEAAGGTGKTLVLDLTIETGSGSGLDVLVWKRATHFKTVSAGQYDSVEIRWDGKAIATCRVMDDAEHHGHLVALTAAANKAQAGKAKPRPAPAKPKPRPAPKKPMPAAPKKRPPAAKKRKSAAAKTRAPAPKKRAPAAKKRAPVAKKRKSVAAKKRVPAAKKRKSVGSRKRAPTSAKKRRSAAKKRRPASRRK